MFTRDDIPRKGRIQEPVTVTVVDVSGSSNAAVDNELEVEDGDGDRLDFYIWSKHGIDVDWQIDHQYELRDVRGKWWTSNGETSYRLSSTSGPVGDESRAGRAIEHEIARRRRYPRRISAP